MSWFSSSGFASISKTVKEVQKKIDKVLDINEEPQNALSDDQKAASTDLMASAWGSFSGSFFDNAPRDHATTSPASDTPSGSIVETQPPRSASGLAASDGDIDPNSCTRPSSNEELLSMKSPHKSESVKGDDPPGDVSLSEDKQECNKFEEVNLHEGNLDTDGIAKTTLTVDSEKLTELSFSLHLQTPTLACDQNSGNDHTQSEFSVKSDSPQSFNSPDSLEVLRSKSTSPTVAQAPSISDCQQIRSESQSHVEILALSVDSSSPSDESVIFGKDLNPDVLGVPLTDDTEVEVLSDKRDQVRSSSDDATSSGSIEMISSDSGGKSSSIELMSSCPSSGPISPEEFMVAVSASSTDQRNQEKLSDAPAITKQPTSSVSDWSRCSEEDVFSSQDTPSAYASFAEDASACESIHSASTSSTHTVLDAFPSQHLDLGESLIDTYENEICEEDEFKDDDVVFGKTDIYDNSDEEVAETSEEANKAFMEEKEAEIDTLIEEGLKAAKQTATKSDSSDSQGVSSSPERESPPSDSYIYFTSRSERRKTQSEHTSGHSSPCETETETATSSDIEIISSPSLDGSNGGYRRVPMTSPPGVAAKMWLSAQKGIRSFISERADPAAIANEESVPSSLTTGFTSISESSGESPHAPGTERLSLEMGKVNQSLLEFKSHRRNKSSVSEYSESSSDVTGQDMEKLLKKLTQLNEIVDAREAKVLELSHRNSTLTETNAKLKSRLDEAEKLRNGTDSNEAIREECTQRLAIMERKFQKALKDNESLTKIVDEYRAEAAEQRSAAQLAKKLDEKETTIQELMTEGEKLSKQQLNYSNIIKKLRAKEKETDAVLNDQKSKLERQSTDLERFHKQLGAKEEIERKQIDAIRQLTVANQKQEVDLKIAIADRDESDGKFRSMKDVLDSAYREIAELQKTISTNDADAQQNALKNEIDARQTMESSLNELKRQTHQEQQSFMAQIHELQDSVRSSDAQANRKERQLKHDLSAMQDRLAASESRNKDIMDDVAAATRPLLRTINNLQMSQRVKQESWEALEESLEERLRQAEKSAATSLEKERAMKEEHSDAISELTNFQTKVTELETEKNKFEAEIEIWKKKFATVDEIRIKDSNQLEALRRSFAEEVKTARRENDILRNQLTIETTSVTDERRKNSCLQDQLKERDRKIAHLQTVSISKSSVESSPTPSMSGSVSESVHSSHWMDDVFDSTTSRGTSLYESLRNNSAMTVDIMTSTVRQREGELRHVQSELARSDAQKNSLAKEMMAMSQQIEELSTKAEEYKCLKASYHELDKKHNALLQLYGEKIEEVDELRLDLIDVKEMYKSQIEQLLQKN